MVTKKKGGEDRSQRLMVNFHDSLDFCGLVDLDYRGADFTWSGRRAGGQIIWCRLDRFCANPGSIALFQ